MGKKITEKNDFIFLSTIFLSTNSRIENKSVSGKSGKSPSSVACAGHMVPLAEKR